MLISLAGGSRQLDLARGELIFRFSTLEKNLPFTYLGVLLVRKKSVAEPVPVKENS
jgi:hypothetical protein